MSDAVWTGLFTAIVALVGVILSHRRQSRKLDAVQASFNGRYDDLQQCFDDLKHEIADTKEAALAAAQAKELKALRADIQRLGRKRTL